MIYFAIALFFVIIFTSLHIVKSIVVLAMIGKTRPVLLMTIPMPYASEYDRDQIKKQISDKITKIKEEYNCLVMFSHRAKKTKIKIYSDRKIDSAKLEQDILHSLLKNNK